MKILYLTKGNIHPDMGTQKVVLSNIESIYRGKNVEIIQNEVDVIKEINLKEYDALVVFFHLKEDDEIIISKIRSYVEDGGTIIALHGAGASFKTSEDWFELIGGRFIMHPPTCELEVECGEYRAKIIDEFYIMDLKDDIVTHAFSIKDDEKIPCLWSKNYRKGRVVYLALGHDVISVSSEAYKVALNKAFEIAGLL